MWKPELLFLIFTIISNIWCPIQTYPQGAPESVCQTMLPFHGGGIPPKISPPPFRIESTSNIIGQGQSLRVEIQPVPNELSFGGFMIQARNRYPPYQVIGQFSDRNEGNIKFMNCGGPQSSATHINPSAKQGISLEWEAPLDFVGEIVFNTTVAQEYDKFWVGIQSDPIRIVKREVAPPSVVGIPTTRQPYSSTVPVYIPEVIPLSKKSDPFYDGCGSTKTCFGLPDGCLTDKSCRSIVAITVRGSIYEFELKSGYNQPAYVAAGLSEDDKMGDDLVIECIQQGGRILAYTSYTTPRPNLGVSREDVPQNTHRLLTGNYINGTIYCKVEKDSVIDVKGKRFDLVNNKYYLLIASGKSIKSNGVGYHDNGRLPSSNAINLAVVQELGGSSTLLLRLHGAFMICAWIGTTSIGIVLARYFKQTWVGSQLCGKDMWFAWHRICMVVTWALTIAGFIIIFIEIDGWSAERNPHAILGVITTIICFIQPIGALFRPAPNSKNRPYFNWGHWFGGNVAHILAIVTIFFAVKLTKAELPEWMDWILVAYVAFHVIMHLIFSISGCASDRQKQRVNSFPMSDMSHGRNNLKIERKGEAPFAKLRKGLLIIYTIVIILFVIALIVIISLAPIEETFKSFKSKIMENNN